MPERDGYIPGVPCWVDTSQPDPEAAVAFYSGVFGWECEDVMPPDAPGRYFMAVLADPEGAVFCAWQAGRHQGARIVNEHGSVNFNGLNTRDPQAAAPFYRAVFGWEVLDLGGGGAMWTLPGYAEELERNDPGLRERMAEAGAPKGFADVVATINPIGDDQPDVPAHWSVTFAVDDADAAAEAATRLGGQVVVPPFDAPWVRMAVIADPAGATFIASKFVPENARLAAV